MSRVSNFFNRHRHFGIDDKVLTTTVQTHLIKSQEDFNELCHYRKNPNSYFHISSKLTPKYTFQLNDLHTYSDNVYMQYYSDNVYMKLEDDVLDLTFHSHTRLNANLTIKTGERREFGVSVSSYNVYFLTVTLRGKCPDYDVIREVARQTRPMFVSIHCFDHFYSIPTSTKEHIENIESYILQHKLKMIERKR